MTVPLPGMSYEDIGSHFAVTKASLKGTRGLDSMPVGWTLCRVWDVAVNPVLQSLKIKSADGTPLARIWWIGIAQQIPFHAASHQKSSGGSAITGSGRGTMASSSPCTFPPSKPSPTRARNPRFSSNAQGYPSPCRHNERSPTRKPLDGVSDGAKELIQLPAPMQPN